MWSLFHFACMTALAANANATSTFVVDHEGKPVQIPAEASSSSLAVKHKSKLIKDLDDSMVLLARHSLLTSSKARGVPAHIFNSQIPDALEQEASRCAASWKTNVFTPRLTTQEEMQEPVAHRMISRFHEEPVMHRKQWEYIFLLKVMDVVPKFHKAVGFAVGLEPTVSYLASRNVSVTATDLAPAASHAADWQATNQLMLTMEKMNERNIATPAQMEKYVSQEFVNMNNVENSKVWTQAGTFDFVWSVCSVEHVGSLRQALEFMTKSLQLLSPGGTAVHTTEFNIASLNDTIDHEGTVLFRKKDVDAFHQCATKSGYEMVRPCYDVGSGPIDREIDTPPYSHDRHLRLELGNFMTTCVGMVVHKPRDFVATGYDCSGLFDSLTVQAHP